MQRKTGLNPQTSSDDFDIVIIGGGLTGQAAALALSEGHEKIAVVSGPPASADGRTVALMPEAQALLGDLGLGSLLENQGAPLVRLRLIDDSGSLFRPPSALFHAHELGLDAFAINIENHRLDAGLHQKLASHSHISVISDRFVDTQLEPAGRSVTLASGRILKTRLLVAADGRQSQTRTALGIRSEWKPYDQVAITAIFDHSRPHDNCSTEFHTRAGPFTLVPLPDQRSSLVWLTKPAHGQELFGLSEKAFSEVCEQQAQSILGKMQVRGKRGLLPMARLQVETLYTERAVLLGDAGHAFPPIGAQGLNLGLRDAADLVQSLKGQADPGHIIACQNYSQRRKADIILRSQGVDMLNRSLLSPYLPVDFLRGAGMLALSSIRPLRRFIMEQGIGRPVSQDQRNPLNGLQRLLSLKSS